MTHYESAGNSTRQNHYMPLGPDEKQSLRFIHGRGDFTLEEFSSTSNECDVPEASPTPDGLWTLAGGDAARHKPII